MRYWIQTIIKKAKRLSFSWWKIVLLLAMGVILKSMAIVFWDTGAVTLSIDNKRLFTIGMSFLFVAIFSSCIGLHLWKADRTKGYGVTKYFLGTFFVALLLFTLHSFYEESYLTDAIFIFKYILYSILSVFYWALAKRFIREQFTSLKFLSLFCLELLGFGLAGFIIATVKISARDSLTASLFLLAALSAVTFYLTRLKPVPQESFTKKTDGIQDVFEKPLVTGILMLSLFGVIVKTLSEAVLYQKLSETGISPMVVLGLLWGLFGSLGLIMVLILYHTRYIYTTLAGMLIVGLSVILAGVTALGSHSGPVASSYLTFVLWSHFYLSGYLKILPRVLTGGSGPRLKKRIFSVSMPIGYVFCGVVCLNLNKVHWPYFLIVTGIILILITIRTASLYAQVLLRMFEMRLWRNGPMMISYPRLVKYLMRLLSKKEANEAIYALRTLENANHSSLEEALVEALSHPVPRVRQFAALHVRTLYRFNTFQPLIQKLFQKEKDPKVRQVLLTDLILLDPNPKQYLSYLKNDTLKSGVIWGFLALTGKWDKTINKTIKEYFEQMLLSKDVQSNLTALKILAHYPDPSFTPFLEPLLKHSSHQVVCQAMLVAARIKDTHLIQYVFRALDDVNLQETALLALKNYGKEAFPLIESIIKDKTAPGIRRKKLILFLGALPSGEGKLLLMRMLAIEDQKLRKNIARSIFDSGISWIHPDRKNFLHRYLKKDLERISWLLHVREKYSESPTHEAEEAFSFFLRALQEDIDDTRELILYQLLLLNNDEMFTRAVRILLTDSYDLYLPALGMIQDMLSGKFYQALKPVLILPLSHKRGKALSPLSIDDLAQGLKEVIINPKFTLNHWIRTTALCVLRRLMSPKGISIANAALSDPHPVVLEAAIWTLARLQSDKEELHKQLLTIPTSNLSRISLDYILEN